MNDQEYTFIIFKKPELNIVKMYARGVKNRENTEAADIINLDILNNFLG